MEPVEKKTKNLGIRASVDRWRLLNRLALDRDTSVQALVDEAIERWLTREIPDEKDEQKMTTSTETPSSAGKFGTPNLKDAPDYPKIVQKSTGQGTDPGGQETDHLTESENERSPSEIPFTRADAARIEAKVDRLIESLAKGRTGVGGVANPLEIAKTTAKRANRVKRLVSRRKGKHPPRFESGA